MKTKNEDIIRKLFESKCSLSPEERAALNNYEYVNDTFHRQWEEMSEEAVDLVREEKILNGIMKKVRGRRFPFIKKSFYKYGMAAMIAVCMVLSALLLMKNSGEEKPNEKLTYSKTDGISLTTIDADAYSSWRQGKRMSFKNETLEMILERLEKWYGQKIECVPHIARHYRFTFTMHSESLDLILNYISHSAPLNYRLISNDHYIIEEMK